MNTYKFGTLEIRLHERQSLLVPWKSLKIRMLKQGMHPKRNKADSGAESKIPHSYFLLEG